MKKMIMLVILMITIVGCSYMEGGERAIKERGLRCRYNYKGNFQGCNYLN